MSGIIGKKIGMAQIFEESGKMIPVTYVLCEPNVIWQIKTAEKDGVDAVVLGADRLKKERKTKTFRHLIQINGFEEGKKGEERSVSLFSEGELVSITATSKGKGFTGQVKRHNFRVARKTHGTKEARHGSTGACAMPGRTKPGIKMAGRHGNKRVTLRDCIIVRVDSKRNLIAVKGPLPGAINGTIVLKKKK